MSTSKPIVAITRALPGIVEVPGADVRMGGERAFSRAELMGFVKGATALVTWVSEKVDEALLDAAGPQLKGVCNYAVGTDNIDRAACAKRGIVVTNTPNVVTEGTADLAWMLILAVARRLIPADRFARGADYATMGPLGPTEFTGRDLTGRTLLIVGAGRIGQAVALRSIGWGMKVLYVAREKHWEFELAPLAAERVTLEEGMRRADVVSVHTPLTAETRHIINAKNLALMKETAILINTARGPVVDEQALVECLKAKKIWGAGLDVFEKEPVVHPELVGMENVVLTPHIGSAALKYREMMTAMALDNARAVVEGKRPANVVG
jgi:glyoxylate reductase